MNDQPTADPLHTQLQQIKLVITDVDGVLTDGGLIYDEHGEKLKRFHVRDGLGIRLLIACNIQVAVLSGRDSAILRRRIADLGIDLFHLAVKDKAKYCQKIMQAANVSKQQTAYIGDDTIDLPAFASCGLNFTVPEAAFYIKNQVDDTLKTKAGYGAFRELADRILIAQGKKQVLSSYQGYQQVLEQMVL